MLDPISSSCLFTCILFVEKNRLHFISLRELSGVGLLSARAI